METFTISVVSWGYKTLIEAICAASPVEAFKQYVGINDSDVVNFESDAMKKAVNKILFYTDLVYQYKNLRVTGVDLRGCRLSIRVSLNGLRSDAFITVD